LKTRRYNGNSEEGHGVPCPYGENPYGEIG